VRKRPLVWRLKTRPVKKSLLGKRLKRPGRKKN
jgi:hypothetical protein